jgi:hypothetical protein
MPRPYRSVKRLQLARYLEYADFAVLHARYRCAGGLRYTTPYTRRRLISGVQSLFALPEGHTAHPAALSITEGDESLEPIHLLKLG